MDKIRPYVAAAITGVTSGYAQQNLSADQIAERAWDIAKRTYEWELHGGNRPPQPLGGLRR